MSPFSKRLAAVLVGVGLVVSSFIAGTLYAARNSYAGTDVTGSVINRDIGGAKTADFGPFWQAWNILNDKYVPTKKKATTTEQDKVWGAIKGLAESYGDPYTTFFPPVEAKSFKEEISGNFEGLGIEVAMKDNIVTVVSPLKDTPADKAGIKPGDKVLKIDDRVTTTMTLDEAIGLMKGKKGTTVRLTILSVDAKQPRELTIKRDTINIPNDKD
jgi:carboxyl-terminal processing protease